MVYPYGYFFKISGYRKQEFGLLAIMSLALTDILDMSFTSKTANNSFNAFRGIFSIQLTDLSIKHYIA